MYTHRHTHLRPCGSSKICIFDQRFDSCSTAKHQSEHHITVTDSHTSLSRSVDVAERSVKHANYNKGQGIRANSGMSEVCKITRTIQNPFDMGGRVRT